VFLSALSLVFRYDFISHYLLLNAAVFTSVLFDLTDKRSGPRFLGPGVPKKFAVSALVPPPFSLFSY